MTNPNEIEMAEKDFARAQRRLAQAKAVTGAFPDAFTLYTTSEWWSSGALEHADGIGWSLHVGKGGGFYLYASVQYDGGTTRVCAPVHELDVANAMETCSQQGQLDEFVAAIRIAAAKRFAAGTKPDINKFSTNPGEPKTTLDGPAIARRIRHIVSCLDSSSLELDRRIGIDPGSVMEMLQGLEKYPDDSLRTLPVAMVDRIADAGGVSLQWLLFGGGDHDVFARPGDDGA